MLFIFTYHKDYTHVWDTVWRLTTHVQCVIRSWWLGYLVPPLALFLCTRDVQPPLCSLFSHLLFVNHDCPVLLNSRPSSLHPPTPLFPSTFSHPSTLTGLGVPGLCISVISLCSFCMWVRTVSIRLLMLHLFHSIERPPGSSILPQRTGYHSLWLNNIIRYICITSFCLSSAGWLCWSHTIATVNTATKTQNVDIWTSLGMCA